MEGFERAQKETETKRKMKVKKRSREIGPRGVLLVRPLSVRKADGSSKD